MIGSLRGTLIERRPRPAGGLELLIEVGGVGYRVVAPASGGGADLGDSIFVHVHTHVREDAIVLYAFPTREERTCFEALIGAHGVGPAVALNLLGVHRPAALARVVAAGDVDALKLVPGIGAKTAARLMVELQARLGRDLDLDGLEVVGGPAGGAGARSEVRAALAALGYGADEIRQALAGLPDEGGVEDQLRLALREMSALR
jgi:Holliday junction DNA helicase RuvA